MLGKTSELCFGHVIFAVESVPLTKGVARGLQECTAFHQALRTLKFYVGSVVPVRAEGVKRHTRHPTSKTMTKKRNPCI